MALYLVGVFPSREGLGVGAASFEVIFVPSVTEFQGSYCILITEYWSPNTVHQTPSSFRLTHSIPAARRITWLPNLRRTLSMAR